MGVRQGRRILCSTDNTEVAAWIKLTLSRAYIPADAGGGYSGRAMMMALERVGDMGDNGLWTVSPVFGGGSYQLRNVASGNLLAQGSDDPGLVVVESDPTGSSVWDFHQFDDSGNRAAVLLGSSSDRCIDTGPVPLIWPPMNVPARLLPFQGNYFTVEQVS